MPNHCSNRLTVTGPTDQVREFGIHAMSDEKEERDIMGKPTGKKFRDKLSLDSFLPIPKELEGTVSPSRDPEPVRKALVAKYGFDNWYDWRCAKQGTKWGCYDVEAEADRKGKVVYTFHTAWSPFRKELLQEMSRLFPKLTLRYEFAERGSAFYGFWEAKGGKVVDEEENSVEEDQTYAVDENDKEVPKDSDDVYTYKFRNIPDAFVELLETSG